MAINPPAMPFNGYKWRWASLTPSEGLNKPSVYLGVLRTWAKYDGVAASDNQVVNELAVVQNQTGTGINLARTGERNLKRNSGQYWSALGVLGNSSGVLDVTTFGHKVASGKITPTEFAVTTVKTLKLANNRIEDTSGWDQARLSIRPLQLIIQIMNALAVAHSASHAKLTPDELVKIVIPLAGAKAPIPDYVEALYAYRSSSLSLVGWPNCAPASNDERMAREFLLFLANYGICEKVDSASRGEEVYRLPSVGNTITLSTKELITLPVSNDLVMASGQVQATNFLADVERHRVRASILARPQQARFRREVLTASDSKCFVTGVGLKEALEAAHIKPVSDGGNDHVSNGLCLRADIHALFDTGHLRVDKTGRLHLSEVASHRSNYASLPQTVALPLHASLAHIDWRWKYK